MDESPDGCLAEMEMVGRYGGMMSNKTIPCHCTKGSDSYVLPCYFVAPRSGLSL